MTYYIGLMSGTSMDGIDAALVDLPNHKLICGITKPYSEELKKQLNQLVENPNTNLATFCHLNTQVGREFAQATKELIETAQVPTSVIRAIGSHGQTICHEPKGNIPYTLQFGCGHSLASLTGIDVIADFRTRDLVLGGQAAPFAPLYHQELFAAQDESVAIVNIGGIANISFINPSKLTTGWDIGPGNCLMDAWIQKHQHKNYDKNGYWAKQGRVIPDLLLRFLADPFFSQKEPKSIGKEYFSLFWLDSYLNGGENPADVQATLSALTSSTIANTLLNSNLSIQTLYLCGGGVHNTVLHQSLTELLPKIQVESTALKHIDPDYLEAMLFAWLASLFISKTPVDLRNITGSNEPMLLGALYPAFPNQFVY